MKNHLCIRSPASVIQCFAAICFGSLLLAQASLQAIERDWRVDALTVTNGGPVITIQIARAPNLSGRHPVILVLGALSTNSLPDWSTNLVQEGYLIAAFTVAHSADPDPKRQAQWLYFDERFAHSYVLGGLRMPGDVSRVIDYLITRSDVDPEKLGWMGSSTTGIFGLAAVTHEPRLKAIVAFVATGAYEKWLSTWKPNGLWRSGTNGLWPETLELLPKADPIHSSSNLFPCAVLMVSGGADKIVDPGSARAFVDTARPFYRSDPNRLRLVVYEGMGHNLPLDVVQLYTEHWFHLYLNPTRPPPLAPEEARSMEESTRRTTITAETHDRIIDAVSTRREPLPLRTNSPVGKTLKKIYSTPP